jgi:hypothetical protein
LEHAAAHRLFMNGAGFDVLRVERRRRRRKAHPVHGAHQAVRPRRGGQLDGGELPEQSTPHGAVQPAQRHQVDPGQRGRRRTIKVGAVVVVEPGKRRVVIFLGSNLGNATPTERAALLTDIATTLNPGDGFLFSVDLLKPAAILDTCYNDPRGHRAFAEFRLNHLTHVNRRFGADFTVGQYLPRAHFVEGTGIVEGHLYALSAQRVRLPRLEVEFVVRSGESINVGFSTKFDVERLDGEMAEHGMTVEHRWLDPEWQYGIFLARRTEMGITGSPGRCRARP